MNRPEEKLEEFAASVDSLTPGDLFDGTYTLRALLGHGGMGEVWLADVDPDRFDYVTLCAYIRAQTVPHARLHPYAEELIQQLRQEGIDAADARAFLAASGHAPVPDSVALKISRHSDTPHRFAAEWKNLICMDHPNVIQVFGGGTYRGAHYYAMEHVQGPIPIDRLVSDFDLAEKLEIILQAAQGLSHLHGNGIIHRDIKPSNLLTYRSGPSAFCTKIADLGVCKFQTEDSALGNAPVILGTPCYMSPEQVVNCRDLDHRSDIYSLGASLYELLTGRTPYLDCGQMYEIMTAIVDGAVPVPPEVYLPSLPSAVGTIVRHAMAHKADERYQTADELAHDIELFLAGGAPDPLDPPLPRCPRKAPPSTAILAVERMPQAVAPPAW